MSEKTEPSEKIGTKVTFVTITEDHDGQRIDNFLLTKLKGMPKSAIYKILRKGEVRVNKKRVKPLYKLKINVCKNSSCKGARKRRVCTKKLRSH